MTVSNLTAYREQLLELKSHLSAFGVPEWPHRLEQWVSELDLLEGGTNEKEATAHLRRTHRALYGMGSVADIVICPEAGHDIPDDEVDVSRANTRLLDLVSAVYAEVQHLLSDADA